MKQPFLQSIFITCLFFMQCHVSILYSYSFQPKSLLFFIDNESKERDAITYSVVQALSQGTDIGPIFISGSLLRAIFSTNEEANTELGGKTNEELINIYQPMGKNKEEEKYILKKALNFNQSDWIIKKINNTYYLFIPNTSEYRFDKNKLLSETEECSKNELQLGLKAEHLETVDLYKDIVETTDSFTQIDFLPVLKKTFCERKDYDNSKRKIPYKGKIPSWSLFGTGHGAKGSIIIGLKLGQFKEALLFFDAKINTRLLTFISCYAAGVSFEKIFNDYKNNFGETYSFAIITQAITDSPVFDIPPKIKNINNELKIKSKNDYVSYKKKVTEDVINYKEAFTQLHPSVPRALSYQDPTPPWGNIPQIKLPGLEWFSVLDSDKKIASIGSILTQTRDEYSPLNITTFFKSDPLALLVYGSNIPFELQLNEKLEAIISMIPGNATHRFKKITSKKDINSVINLFLQIEKLDPKKIFYCEEIIADNSVFTDNIIFNEEDSVGTGFISNPNALFIKKITGDIRAAKPKEKELYKKILSELKGEFIEIEELTISKSQFQRNTLTGIPKFRYFTKIKKIVTKPEDNISLTNILNTIYKNTFSTFVWIEEIKAVYTESSRTKIPSVQKNTLQTITDVIIASPEKKGIFFTHNGVRYQLDKKIDFDYLDQYKKKMKGTAQKETGAFDKEDIETIKKAQKRKSEGETTPPEYPKPPIVVDPLAQKLNSLHQTLLDLHDTLKR